MSDTGHHGHRAGCHGTGERLVVEGHEVLERTSPAHKQDTVGRGIYGRRARKPLDELSGRPVALHLRADADELHERVAAAQRALHVVDNRARQRGDHRHARAEHGDAALAGVVAQALEPQLLGKRRDLLA